MSVFCCKICGIGCAIERYVNMMKRISAGIAIFTLFLLPLYLNALEMQTIEYHGIRPSDPGGRDGLRNPERGFRLETRIGEFDEDVDRVWAESAERYRKHGVSLVLAYCYLTHYADRPIEKSKLKAIQASLDNFRKHGMKVVLRFAYEQNMFRQYGPEFPTILMHLDQLEPLIRANADVIYVLQAGFIGAWGEWHSSTHGLEHDHAAVAAIVQKLLRVLPDDRMTQVRVPKYKRWVLGDSDTACAYVPLMRKDAWSASPKARIGYHNDGFLANRDDGSTWLESPYYANPGNPEFDQMTMESRFVPVDGELFVQDQGGKVDGMRAAARLKLHHYGSFSLMHSFSELDGEKPGRNYSIDEWMKTEIRKEALEKNGLPVSDGYFEDESGNKTVRTQFEYIRDHLGYRLELRSAVFPSKISAGEDLLVSVDMVNCGFAVIQNPRPVYLVLIDQRGEVFEFKIKDADPRRWSPSILQSPAVSLDCKLSEYIKPGRYKMGLWLSDAYPSIRLDSRYAVKVANRDAPWWTDKEGEYGINILGEIEVQGEKKDKGAFGTIPVAYWSFDKIENGAMRDETGNGLDGRLVDLPERAIVPGKKGMAIRFNGSKGYLHIGNKTILSFKGREPFTITAWINPEEENLTGVIIGSFNKEVLGQYYLELRDGKLRFAREVSPWDTTGDIALEKGKWHWIAAVYDGFDMSIYVNGDPVAPPVGSSVVSSGFPDVLVGAYLINNMPGRYFKGLLDELCVYRCAFSPEEVKLMYRQHATDTEEVSQIKAEGSWIYRGWKSLLEFF